MKAGARKFLLLLHILTSVGTVGAVAAFWALALLGQGVEEAAARGAYLAMEIIAWWVILPLLGGALLIGVLQSLISSWGLVRHYWVVGKLALTAVALGVLMLQSGGIGMMANTAREIDWPWSTEPVQQSLLVHASGGLLVLALATLLSVYKPRGMTPYGWRVTFAAGGPEDRG